MKLKCKINNEEYENLVSGATFSEEFNETLDSGSLIISHVPKIENLAPYDDVFIYNGTEEFDGYINKGDVVSIRSTTTTILKDIPTGAQQSEIAINGDNLKINQDDSNFYISGKIINIWRYFCYDFNSNNASHKCKYIVDLFFDLIFEYNTLDQDENVITLTVDFNDYYPGSIAGGKHVGENDDLRLFSSLGSLYETIDIYFDNQNNRIVIPKNAFLRNYNGNIIDVSLSDKSKVYSREQKNTFEINILDANNFPAPGQMIVSGLVNGAYNDYVLTSVDKTNPLSFEAIFSFSVLEQVVNESVTFTLTNEGFYKAIIDTSAKTSPLFNDVYDIKIPKINYVQQEKTELPSFYKHMLVDNYIEEQLTFGDSPLFKYKLSLCSETKGLEKTIIPNVSITQSIFSTPRTCLFYLKHFVEFYSPKIKKQYNKATQEWEYSPKYKLDLNLAEEKNEQSVDAIFGNVNCPEMSLTNPTLREVLSRIMIVKDCIPVVKDNVIYAMKIGETKDTFTNFGEKFGGTFEYNPDKMSFPIYSMDSKDYATSARREYSGAISQKNTARYIEYLGFRNSSNSLMSLDNLQIETRFPIYKINKLYLCYYKKAEIDVLKDDSTTETQTKSFMCKHDITDLVLQNSVRNALSADWTKYPDEINSRDDMKKYRILTLGYDIGGKTITGWGTKYSYITSPLAWINKEKTYLENILELLENHFNQGTENLRENLKQKLGMIGSDVFSSERQQGVIRVKDWEESMIVPPGITGSQKIKSVFFQMDYNAMYDGAILHSKDNVENDIIETSDNCSSALSILEIDGLFEKEKMNRIGNKTFNLQGRYYSYEEMQQNNNVLGSVYDNDIIIYHREYSIYNDYIQASFTGTYDYVMKNYFTSVFAKLRMYNFMSYEESTLRSENEKWFIELSTNSCLFEQNNLDSSYLISAFNKTIVPRFYGDINTPLLINGGYFTRSEKIGDDPISGTPIYRNVKYYSDFNGFVSGVSLCFNIQMFDNVTHGVYISTFDTTISDADPDVKGSVQEWYVATDTPSDAFIKKIGCFIGHFDKKDYFMELPNLYTPENEQKIQDRIQDILYLPKAPDASLETIFVGLEKDYYKDNKEILNVTFQFEPISYDKNIAFSEWLMKLSDLITVYNKFDKDISVYDFSGFSADDSEKINFYYTTVVEETITDTLDYAIHYTPSIFIRFDNNLNIEANSTLQLTIPEVKKWLYTRDGITVEYLEIVPLNIKQKNSDGSLTITCRFYRLLYFANQLKETTEETSDCIFVNTNSSIEGYTDYVCYFENYTKLFEYYYLDGKSFDKSLESSKLSIKNSIIYDGFYIDDLYATATYPKTMYILDSENPIKKELVYDRLDIDNLPDDFTIISTENFNDVFSFLVGDDGVPYIYVDTNKIVSQRTANSKSLQYWFKDEDGLLKFVFGVNIGIREQDKKVYLSVVKKRSKIVYNEKHMPTSHVVNFLSDSDKGDFIYGEGQKYNDND